MSQEKDDFDFSEIIGEPAKEPVLPSGETEKPEHPYQGEVQTSYLLVNALMTLLVRKGIIHPHEVQALVAELHIEYMKKRGRGL
jgi:hypothetical protein